MPNDNTAPRPMNSGDLPDRSVLADPFIGFELEDTYLIEALLGSGGWGNVYRAKRMTDGTDWAVKIVHKHHLNNEMSLKRFELEAKLLSRLENRYIVNITEYGFSPQPYIVMEYFDGEPLSQWIRVNGPMNSGMAIDLFLQLCDGLNAAQQMKIVHRDLKPANILLKIDGSRVQAKILDFGLAKFTDQSTGADKLTSTGDVLGSPPYMSPEQWKGQCDHRSDIYSLGCIMYEVLAGKPAFTAAYGMDYLNKHLTETPQSLSDINFRDKFPPALEDIVRKCMQKSPANRYQSAAACGADLRKVKIGRKPMVILAEDKKTIKTKWALIVAVLLSALLATIYFLRENIVHSLSSYLYTQADSKMSTGQTDDAIGQYRQILNLSQILPEKDMQKMKALRSLSKLLRERKEVTAADSLDRQVNELIGVSSSNPGLLVLIRRIQTSIEQGKLDDAEKQCKTALELAESSLGKHSMAYASCLDLAGTVAIKREAWVDAINSETEALALAQELLEPNDLQSAEIMDHLAAALKGAGKLEESDKYAGLSLALRSNIKSSTVTAEAQPNTKTPSVQAEPSEEKAVSSTAKVSAKVPVALHAKPVSAAHPNPAPLTSVKPHPIVSAAANTPAPKKIIKPIVKAVTPPAAKPPAAQAKSAASSSGWGELEKLRGFR